MAFMTAKDLLNMKRDGKKIAAAVVYDFQMTRICERAGIDLLSVGDSLGRNVLAVVKGRERAVVSVDMPTTPSRAGAEAVAAAAKRFKDEAGVDMVKVDIRTHEEELFDAVPAVIAMGLQAYPQIGFPTQGPSTGIQSGPEVEEHVMKWALRIQEAGAAMIDLTNVPPDVYEKVCKTLTIPVIGGQAPQMADGKIQVMFSGIGGAAATIDRDDGRPNASKWAYDVMQGIINDIHSGKWGTGQ